MSYGALLSLRSPAAGALVLVCAKWELVLGVAVGTGRRGRC